MLEPIHHANELRAYAERLKLYREDIGKVCGFRRAASFKALPPPSTVLDDEEIKQFVEPPRIKWHKDVVPINRAPGAPKCVPYYRYSTDKQRNSVEWQRDIVAQYYALAQPRFNLPPMSDLEFADPETSGTKLCFERRGGGQMIRYVRPGDHVLCPYFDRLGRDTLDTLQTMKVFVARSVHVHVIDHPHLQYCDPNDPGTISEIQKHAANAEWERSMASFRTRKSYRALVNKGIAMGSSIPLGYIKRPNPNYVAGVEDNFKNPKYFLDFSPHDMAVCEEIYSKWADDSWTAYEIVLALRRRKIMRKATGKEWNKHEVKKVIRGWHERRTSKYLIPVGPRPDMSPGRN